MAVQNIREELSKVLDDFKKYSVSLKDSALSSIKEEYSSYSSYFCDSAVIAYDRSIEIYYDSINTSVEVLQLAEVYKYRNQLLDYSLAGRINSVLFLNLPVFYLSRGLRRKMRNPLLFTTFASLVILPELINPFNRR